jgi:hypothetical protein
MINRGRCLPGGRLTIYVWRQYLVDVLASVNAKYESAYRIIDKFITIR